MDKLKNLLFHPDVPVSVGVLWCVSRHAAFWSVLKFAVFTNTCAAWTESCITKTWNFIATSRVLNRVGAVSTRSAWGELLRLAELSIALCIEFVELQCARLELSNDVELPPRSLMLMWRPSRLWTPTAPATCQALTLLAWSCSYPASAMWVCRGYI
jgi:hypothetical protein